MAINNCSKSFIDQVYRAFSLTWPVSMLINWNKRNYLHEKRVQLPEDFLVHQHGRRFIVLEHQYGRCDVMWKRSVRSIWLDIVSFFFASLLTLTSSQSIKKKKKNLTNSQPSWPLAWSITNISSFFALEYEALDQELDQLNSCLDELETWNDSLNSRIKDLLENMQKAREEGRAMIGLGSKNTWRRFMQCWVMLNVRSRCLRATCKVLNVM